MSKTAEKFRNRDNTKNRDSKSAMRKTSQGFGYKHKKKLTNLSKEVKDKKSKERKSFKKLLEKKKKLKKSSEGKTVRDIRDSVFLNQKRKKKKKMLRESIKNPASNIVIKRTLQILYKVKKMN